MDRHESAHIGQRAWDDNHISGLLIKAKRFGLDAEGLERLAIQRGCDYYHEGEPLPPASVSANKKGHKAYYINLEAKPGMGDKVEQFMRDILAGVEQEPGTGPWFGCRFSDTTFGIFEAFPDSAARDAHDIGPGGRNFLRSELLDEMLAYPSHLYRLDVVFGKFTTMFGKKITPG